MILPDPVVPERHVDEDRNKNGQDDTSKVLILSPKNSSLSPSLSPWRSLLSNARLEIIIVPGVVCFAIASLGVWWQRVVVTSFSIQRPLPVDVIVDCCICRGWYGRRRYICCVGLPA